VVRKPIERKSNLLDTNHWPPGGVERSVTVTGEEHLRRHVIPPRSKISTTSGRPTGRRAAHICSGRMSQSSQSHSKKRKQAPVTEAGGDVVQPALKKSKRTLEKKQKKARSKAGPSTGHGTSSSSNGEFQMTTSTLSVSIPPIYAMEPRRGVQEMLDGMLMRYGFW